MTMHRIEAGQRGLEIVELVELCAALELNLIDALREAGLK